MTQPGKVAWSGVLTSIQPRIRLTRSFDQRSHTYQGYVLRVSGTFGGKAREITVAIGEAAHAKHCFQAGDTVSGVGEPVADPRLETAELYKVSKLRVLAPAAKQATEPPPWHGPPPTLPVYRERGHFGGQAHAVEVPLCRGRVGDRRDEAQPAAALPTPLRTESALGKPAGRGT